MDSAATQCQVCWRVRDNRTEGSSCAVWSDMQTFMNNHDVTSRGPSFSEGYCPQCTTSYRRLTEEHPYDA